MICGRQKNLGDCSNMALPEKRGSLSLNLTPHARAVIEAIREDTGVPNTTSTERILEWFSRMPRKFRVAILTGDPEGQAEMLVAWFKETMQASGKGVDVVDRDDINARLRLAHQILNEVELAYEGMKHVARKKKG